MCIKPLEKPCMLVGNESEALVKSERIQHCKLQANNARSYRCEKRRPNVTGSNAGANEMVFFAVGDDEMSDGVNSSSGDTTYDDVVENDVEEDRKEVAGPAAALGINSAVNPIKVELEPVEREWQASRMHLDHRNINRPGSKLSRGTATFVTILLHALKCSNCDQVPCRKMQMVLEHYKRCRNKRLCALSAGVVNKGCKLCQQLLNIVGDHSKFLCRFPVNQPGCPVLMCDAFRTAGFSKYSVTRKPRSASSRPEEYQNQAPKDAAISRPI